MKNEFKINNKVINIYISNASNKDLPLVILNSYSSENEVVLENLKKLNCHDYVLAIVSNLNWNDDMTPWEAPNLNKKEPPFKGKADNYLNELINNIIPKVKGYLESVNIEIKEYIIAGYSLAGLFAIYSAYKTDIFSKIVSASGSLWYPNFLNFVKENDISRNINKIYLSLGNKESQTKNKILKTVETNTKEIQKIYKNINTIYEENEGNHFQDTPLRIAKGIKWILEGK